MVIQEYKLTEGADGGWLLFVWKIILYCPKYKPGIVRIIDCVIILFSKLFFLRLFPSEIVGIYDSIRDAVLNIELIIFKNISY